MGPMGPNPNLVGSSGVNVAAGGDGQSKNKQQVLGLLAGWRHRVKLRGKSRLEFTKQKESKENLTFGITSKLLSTKELVFVSCQNSGKELTYNGHKCGTSVPRQHTCAMILGQSMLTLRDEDKVM